MIIIPKDKIVPGSENDYDELLYLWEASVRSTHHFLTEADIEFFKPLIRNQYFSAVDLYVIRNKQNHIAAFMGLSHDLIEMLFVLPEEQGKGYGKCLIKYALQKCDIEKVDVNEQNEQALHFYLKQGFNVTGRDATDALGKPFPILHMQRTTSLASRLSTRFHIENIREIIYEVKHNEQRKQELYHLIFDTDDTVSYQALWTITHLPHSEYEWLQTKLDELIDEALVCPHPGKRRILLQILERLTYSNTPRVDFLDFCMEKMLSGEELPALRSVCIKLAYQLCRFIPELLQELRSLLELMEPELLPPSIRSVRTKTLKAIRTSKKQIKI